MAHYGKATELTGLAKCDRAGLAQALFFFPTRARIGGNVETWPKFLPPNYPKNIFNDRAVDAGYPDRWMGGWTCQNRSMNKNTKPNKTAEFLVQTAAQTIAFIVVVATMSVSPVLFWALMGLSLGAMIWGKDDGDNEGADE